jgi:hypothetical protein
MSEMNTKITPHFLLSPSAATLTMGGEALLPSEAGITLERIEHGAAIDKE